MDRLVKARIRALSAVCSVAKFITPRGSVQCPLELTTSSGSRNAFQLPTTASTATVARAGRESGSRIRQKNPNVLQPSMAAASSSSRGDAPEERPQDDDRHGRPKAACGQGHPERVVEQAERPDEDVQRQDRDRAGNSRPSVKSVNRSSRPRKAIAGEDEGRKRRERDHDDASR